MLHKFSDQYQPSHTKVKVNHQASSRTQYRSLSLHIKILYCILGVSHLEEDSILGQAHSLLARHRSCWAPFDVVGPFLDRTDVRQSPQPVVSSPQPGSQRRSDEGRIPAIQTAPEDVAPAARVRISSEEHEDSSPEATQGYCTDMEAYILQAAHERHLDMHLEGETAETVEEDEGREREGPNNAMPDNVQTSQLQRPLDSARTTTPAELSASQSPQLLTRSMFQGSMADLSGGHAADEVAMTPEYPPPLTKSPDPFLAASPDFFSFSRRSLKASHASLVWSVTTAGSSELVTPEADLPEEEEEDVDDKVGACEPTQNLRRSVTFNCSKESSNTNGVAADASPLQPPPSRAVNKQKKSTRRIRSTAQRAELGWSVARLSVSLALDELPPPAFSGLSSRVRLAVERDEQQHRALPSILLGESAKAAFEGLGRIHENVRVHSLQRHLRFTFTRWFKWAQNRSSMSSHWSMLASSIARQTRASKETRKAHANRVRALEGAFAAAVWHQRNGVFRAVLRAWVEWVASSCAIEETFLFNTS
jgi:hypothetical protein